MCATARGGRGLCDDVRQRRLSTDKRRTLTAPRECHGEVCSRCLAVHIRLNSEQDPQARGLAVCSVPGRCRRRGDGLIRAEVTGIDSDQLAGRMPQARRPRPRPSARLRCVAPSLGWCASQILRLTRNDLIRPAARIDGRFVPSPWTMRWTGMGPVVAGLADEPLVIGNVKSTERRGLG